MNALLMLPKALIWLLTLGRVNMFKFKPKSGFPEEVYYVRFRPIIGCDLKKAKKVYESIFSSDDIIAPHYFGEYQEEICAAYVPRPPRNREVELSGMGSFDALLDFWDTPGCCGHSELVTTLLSGEDLKKLITSGAFRTYCDENITDSIYANKSRIDKRKENRKKNSELISSGDLPSRCYDCGAEMVNSFNLEGQECIRCGEHYELAS